MFNLCIAYLGFNVGFLVKTVGDISIALLVYMTVGSIEAELDQFSPNVSLIPSYGETLY